MKFTISPGDHVTVRSANSADAAHLRVSDTGELIRANHGDEDCAIFAPLMRDVNGNSNDGQPVRRCPMDGCTESGVYATTLIDHLERAHGRHLPWRITTPAVPLAALSTTEPLTDEGVREVYERYRETRAISEDEVRVMGLTRSQWDAMLYEQHGVNMEDWTWGVLRQLHAANTA